jgi:hypothetical protein
VPTNDTPPSKSQFGNYVAFGIFWLLAAVAWLGFLAMAWFNRGAFHGSDWWVIHVPSAAPAIFCTACAWTIRREIRRNQAAAAEAAAAKKKS